MIKKLVEMKHGPSPIEFQRKHCLVFIDKQGFLQLLARKIMHRQHNLDQNYYTKL